MISHDPNTIAPTGPVQLDPFGFLDNFMSRVQGLGGSEPSFDPSFVFHTPYIAAPRGPWRFTIQFHNLRARQGTLVLRVHMLPDATNSVARLVNSERILLNRLVQNGGSATISFQGMRGATFAVMGQIPDRTDAAADGLSVIAEGPDEVALADHPLDDAQPTEFGSESLRSTSLMVTMNAATFGNPVSQPCTLSQLSEPAFEAWLAKLGSGAPRCLATWSDAFILQVLERYGMLQPNSRGIAIEGDRDALAALVSGSGVVLERTRLGDPQDVEMSDDRFPIIGRERPARTFANFDFLYSVNSAFGSSNIESLASFIESSLFCLRPGGLAVHLFPFSFSTRPVDALDSLVTQRNDVERIAIHLLSHGHDVAQLKPYAMPGTPDIGQTMFALIARRRHSII